MIFVIILVTMSEQKTNTPCKTCGSRYKSIFCDLKDEQLVELDTHKRSDFYRKGETIFKEGAFARGLFCVNRGKVKLVRTGSSGKEQIVRFASEGDVMGYNAMLSKQSLSVSGIVLEDASICFVPSAQFFNLLKSDNGFSMKLLELTSKNWNHAARLITDMAQKTSKQRLAEMLLWLKETFGLDNEDCLDIVLSREEIASMVGTATEALIRLIGELKKEKLIALNGKKIKLIDIHGLVVLADVMD